MLTILMGFINCKHDEDDCILFPSSVNKSHGCGNVILQNDCTIKCVTTLVCFDYVAQKTVPVFDVIKKQME